MIAGTTLLARDRKGRALAAQVLIRPMLDHRNDTSSSHPFDGPAVWSRDANAFGWRSVLKDIGDWPVPSYVSPAIADDLSGLPTAYTVRACNSTGVVGRQAPTGARIRDGFRS